MKGNKLVNFRADRATLAAIKKITNAYKDEPGNLETNTRGKAIRAAILAAAALIPDDQGDK